LKRGLRLAERCKLAKKPLCLTLRAQKKSLKIAYLDSLLNISTSLLFQLGLKPACCLPLLA
jgi:hypothetical protein